VRKLVKICGSYYNVIKKAMRDGGSIEPDKGTIFINQKTNSRSEEYDTLLHEMCHGYLFYFLEGDNDRIQSIIEILTNEGISNKEAYHRIIELFCETAPKIFMTLISDNPKLVKEMLDYANQETKRL